MLSKPPGIELPVLKGLLDGLCNDKTVVIFRKDDFMLSSLIVGMFASNEFFVHGRLLFRDKVDGSRVANTST